MHVYKIVHGGEFNKNGNLNFTQLFHAWSQILKRDLHGNENFRKRRNIHLIFWDGSINVISEFQKFVRELGKDQNFLGFRNEYF